MHTPIERLTTDGSPRRRRRRSTGLRGATLARFLVAALLALAVSVPLAASPGRPAAAVATVTRGSVNQVYTHGRTPGASLALVNSGGTTVATGTVDEQGAFIFRKVPAGSGYVVREGSASSAPVTVTNPEDVPPPAFYSGASLEAGFGYLPTRDGTLLSVNVTMPADGSSGPWPVLVDYSGYSPSAPGGAPAEAAIYPFLGYVVVGVNMRGTGCSGGAFDFFEPLQSTDGYDVIETVARQSWSNGRVGMVGISYPGISQLYVAATRPPSLAAITPLSVIDDTYRGILYPGGIKNKGFASNWAAQRDAAARPFADQWVRDRVAAGDTTCETNQVLHSQAVPQVPQITFDRSADPSLSYLAPATFVDRIQVPTYLQVQFQDEQTGGHAADLARILGRSLGAQGIPFKATLGNGTHADPLGPHEITRVAEFVDIYVGRKRPGLTPVLVAGLPAALRPLFEDPIVITPSPYQDSSRFPTMASIVADYEARKPVRVRWENGGVPGKEGSPYATAENSYDAWPIPSVVPQRWYLQPDGQLAGTPPTVADTEPRSSSSYLYDPASKRASTFDGTTSEIWKRHPDVKWLPLAEGRSLSFTTPPFTAKTLYAGTASADLWVRSSAADTDFEVTLTEVRPDGKEIAIQSGWLRASRRVLDPARSTVLQPEPTYQAEDVAPLPAGEFVPVRIEMFPFTQIVRPGSRLRFNIEAPGGNQPFWQFDTLPGGATNEVAHSAGRPSSIALPLLPSDPTVSEGSPATPPSCSVPGVTTQAQSLRNQPCRAYLPARVPTGVSASGLGGSVEVRWAAPPAWPTGGAPTGYEVRADPGGVTHTVPAGTTTTTIGDLPSGGPYTVRVRALYAGGPAPWSDASGLVSVGSHERTVEAWYADLLGRSPDPGALTYWSGRLRADEPPARVALALTGSEEYRRRVVRAEYLALLRREPDESGWTFWSDRLRVRPSVDELRAMLLASPEAFAQAGGDAGGYVDLLYQRVLDRAPDPGGRAFVLDRLAGSWTRTQAARFMVTSHEADQRLVTRWFSAWLERPPTPAEAAGPVAALQAGSSERHVVADVVGADPYMAHVTAS
ncbi:MAG: CocE/NonD family hydrolase [Actinobacteria bacterium]|nr:CocE/NonD family hydrolase [Actinomycetota bacterium]